MGGTVLMFAGAAIYYKTRLQPTIAQSLTEAEFVNMADAGKAALYMRWILEELQIFQHQPTKILADNTGAIKLANAQKPTQRTRHVELKHMVILQWCDDKLLSFLETKSESNYSDSLSKATERTMFNQHCDIFMGRRKPAYAALNNTVPSDNTLSSSTNETNIIHYFSGFTCKNLHINQLINNPMYYLLNEQQYE